MSGFCSQCGRPIGDPTVLACAGCGNARSVGTSPLPRPAEGLVGRLADGSLAPDAIHERAHLSRLTRLLCVANYVDGDYQARVLDAIVGPSHRAVAASPGVATAEVVASAVDAERRWRQRDIAVACAVVACAFVAAVVASSQGLAGVGLVAMPTLIMGAGFYWLLVAVAWRVVRGAWRHLAGWLRMAVVGVVSFGWICSWFFMFPFALTYGIAWVTGLVVVLWMRSEARQRLYGDQPGFVLWPSEHLPTQQAARAADSSPDVVSGHFLPFLGLGILRKELESFTCRIDIGRVGATLLPVTSEGLVQAMLRDLKGIDAGTTTCTIKTFIDGIDAQLDATTLGLIPRPLVGAAPGARQVERAREYILVQQVLWDADLFLSALMRRFSLAGGG